MSSIAHFLIEFLVFLVTTFFQLFAYSIYQSSTSFTAGEVLFPILKAAYNRLTVSFTVLMQFTMISPFVD